MLSSTRSLFTFFVPQIFSVCCSWPSKILFHVLTSKVLTLAAAPILLFLIFQIDFLIFSLLIVWRKQVLFDNMYQLNEKFKYCATDCIGLVRTICFDVDRTVRWWMFSWKMQLISFVEYFKHPWNFFFTKNKMMSERIETRDFLVHNAGHKNIACTKIKLWCCLFAHISYCR